MTPKIHRSLAATLVVVLVAIGVLAGAGPAFPTGVDTVAGWSFLGGHAYALAHALLGVVALAQALALTVVARAKVVPAVILTGVVVAGASGVLYMSARQPEAALGLMTLGWLVSLIAAVGELVRQRHRARSGS